MNSADELNSWTVGERVEKLFSRLQLSCGNTYLHFWSRISTWKTQKPRSKDRYAFVCHSVTATKFLCLYRLYTASATNSWDIWRIVGGYPSPHSMLKKNPSFHAKYQILKSFQQQTGEGGEVSKPHEYVENILMKETSCQQIIRQWNLRLQRYCSTS